MKSLKKQRRIQVLSVAGACIVGVLVILWFLPKDSFQFFRSPSEVSQNPPPESELFRLGGLVEEGSLIRGEGETIRFRVTDGGASILVSFTGILPDLFGENQGMIALGYYVNSTFEAVEILAKHDEEYMPKEVVEALKAQGVYQPPDGADAIN